MSCLSHEWTPGSYFAHVIPLLILSLFLHAFVEILLAALYFSTRFERVSRFIRKPPLADPPNPMGGPTNDQTINDGGWRLSEGGLSGLGC